MCSICAGSICAGSGACANVVNHAPEVIKISYSYTSNIVSTIQVYFLTLFAVTKESFNKSFLFLSNRLIFRK